MILLPEAQTVFPEASEIILTEQGVYRVLKGDDEIGYLMKSAPYTNDISGYMNTTPLLIALDKNRQIKQVILLENQESEIYLEYLYEAGLLEILNEKSIEEALLEPVDVVSGATFSSKSIIETFQTRMGMLVEEGILVKRTTTNYYDLFGILVF